MSRPRSVLATCVAALLVAAGLVWWFRPFVEVTPDGTVVELGSGSSIGGVTAALRVAHTTTVVTPAGAYDVVLGAPAGSLAHGLAAADAGEADGDDLHAARGSSFVPLRWAAVSVPSVVVADGVTYEPPDGSGARAELSVVVDGEVVAGPYDLTGPVGSAPEAVAVAVDDDAAVGVEVVVDGQAQVVDADDGRLDPGVAAAYYDEAGDPAGAAASGLVAPLTACAWRGRLPDGLEVDDDELRCTPCPQVTAGPWSPTQGWVAEPGQVWWSVGVTASIEALFVDGEDDYYRASARWGDLDLDGADPVEVANGDQSSRVLFDAFRSIEAATWLLDAVPSRAEVTMPVTVRLTHHRDLQVVGTQTRDLRLALSVSPG